MNFLIKTQLSDAANLPDFFRKWKVGNKDLIISNAYVINPALNNTAIPCDVLYQENHGTGEPNDEMADSMLTAIEGKTYDRIIAIGGGSVIDIAKLFVFNNELRCEEIFAKGASLPKVRNLIAIPTTCGTGSEVTNISIIKFLKKDTKIGLAVPALFPDEAVLIGDMLKTLPWEVFATSSIDALIHAVESYVSPKASCFSRAMAKKAIEIILKGYQKIAGGGKRELPNSEDMQTFLEAATMAGIAFGNAGCAAVHALSYPISGIYHVPHGKANYMVFKGVFDTYIQKQVDLTPLETILKCFLESEDVWKGLFDLLAKIYDHQPLGALGADKSKCIEMAASCHENQQRLLSNNPIALSKEDIALIYENVL